MTKRAKISDQAERDRILHELDVSMLVEAAAGAGKTTSMVGRMVELIAQGKCEINRLAAVTFTRKAAAELRARFQVQLEQSARGRNGRDERARLREAASRSEQCFIGTIHSFCARLLRERPIEAGVDIAFREIEDDEDERLREEAWTEHVNALHAGNDPLVGELIGLGIEISALKHAFLRFAKYPDVEEWPAQDTPLPDFAAARKALLTYARHIRELLPSLPEDFGTDTLIPKYQRLDRLLMFVDLDDPAAFMRLIESVFEASVTIRHGPWPGGKEQALAEEARWKEFTDSHARPLLEQWRAHRYPFVLRAIRPAVERYDRMRRERGVLNFQDLLMRAAALLREQPHIRRYFRERFTHLLVDEFQDTDPIQAEVMMCLTATDPAETDWRACRPAPGALFVVGDPKQSIYRFRRADIVTYNQVKQIIETSGGAVVRLTANFRSSPELIDWVNTVFAPVFPEVATETQPAYDAFTAGRVDGPRGDFHGARRLFLGKEESKNKEALLARESDWIARIIRHALDAELSVTRNERDTRPAAARPDDFLIVTRKREPLSAYAQALQHYAVPHQVTGGAALNTCAELTLLGQCLRAAAEPEDPVALLAALRGGLFGISDAGLYAYHAAGGRFGIYSAFPQGLTHPEAARIQAALERLKRYATWLDACPPAAAAEAIAEDLGLRALAAARPGGGGEAGSFCQALELLRTAAQGAWSVHNAITYLGRLTTNEEEHDGVPAKPDDSPKVRIMNLHKVKGLEAPVVFLAAPVGNHAIKPDLHVDRSGAKTRGYLHARAERGEFQWRSIAHPEGWETMEARELEFLDAEETRLRYVAATRAGSQLVVTLRGSREKENPWHAFSAPLATADEIFDPGAKQAPQVEIQGADMDPVRAAAEIARRWSIIRTPSYAHRAAKRVALKGLEIREVSGENGQAWGSVIHRLLEYAMADAACDLDAFARAELEEAGLSADWTETAAACVHSVMASNLWRRARAASPCLTEVSFHVPGEEIDGRPGAVSGVVDLAFREEAGWIIVDYKTDRHASGGENALVARYASQVQIYAKAWELAAGEPVIEAGLYFVHSGIYRACPLNRGGAATKMI